MTCNCTYVWGHIILILVSCSSLRGICVETPVLTMGANTLTLSVVLQKCTPMCVLVYEGTICECLRYPLLCVAKHYCDNLLRPGILERAETCSYCSCYICIPAVAINVFVF
jgi:hypothetical protein